MALTRKKVKEIPEIVWREIDKNDFISTEGHYTLRVERMDKNYWWWCVYYKKGYAQNGFDDPRAKTEKEAKLLAELCFARDIVRRTKTLGK